MAFNGILDAVEEGLVIIDPLGQIKAFNKRAKEITGIHQNFSKPHPSGTLQPGDLVIIADNRLGYDDGQLSGSDLKVIGVDASGMEQGDAFVAVGLYKTPKVKGICKSWRNKAANDRLLFQVVFNHHMIDIVIDVVLKVIDIKIDGISYKMRYALAIGHMVVISAESDQPKFYQAKGYTIRNETVSELLAGGPFWAKGDALESIDVLNKPISKVFESSTLLSRIEVCIANGHDFFENEYHEINKRPTLCTLKPLPRAQDVLLILFDVSNIETMIVDLNLLIATMEKTNRAFETSGPMADIIGSSHVMQRVRHLAQRAAVSRSTVLITGESGTGKTYIAQEIHKLTFPGEDRPFISVNCTAIPSNLFESELFGYIKGAFTGAEKSGKQGLFELAENGTLFLDEIGELPSDMQVKLLHVLQNKVFYKVGATTPTQVNVRIIVATNKDLLHEISKKQFREDLYYRINGFPIEMPPLRKRKTDLYSLIQGFLERLAQDFGGPVKHLSGEALQILMQYSWPGNIRELENTIELAYNMSDGLLIRPDDLNLSLEVQTAPNLKTHLQEAEKAYILAALEQADYDSTVAMDMLDISKTVFYDKVKKYNIPLKKDKKS